MNTQQVRLDTQPEREPLRTVAKTQCSGCGQYFVGVSAFDTHRISDKKARRGRRCLLPSEMREAGLASEKRLVRLLQEGKPSTEEHEVWYVLASRESAQQFFGDDESA
jgi:hypothetical protein